MYNAGQKIYVHEEARVRQEQAFVDHIRNGTMMGVHHQAQM